jgi:mRNA interferase HigB
MNVISRKTLERFWAGHSDARDQLATWHRDTRKAKWQRWADVLHDHPQASYYKCCLVFNICGNKYRLVVRRAANWKTLFVVGVFTHAEYDRDDWKKHCDCK